MDLKQLEYFVRVAEFENFSKASDRLEIAQPTLSRKVRALEVELRTSLFYRNGRGVLLTDAGRKFLEHARRVLHDTDVALRSLYCDRKSPLEECLVLGTTPTLSTTIAENFVTEFLNEYPCASLVMKNKSTSDLLDCIRLGELDFALIQEPPNSKCVVADIISHEPFFLVSKKPIGVRQDSVSVFDLVGLPLILPTEGHWIRERLERVASQHKLILDGNLNIDAPEVTIKLVSLGGRHAVLPASAWRPATTLDTVCWQRIDARELSGRLCLVRSSDGTLSPLCELAITLARNVVLSYLSRSRLGVAGSGVA